MEATHQQGVRTQMTESLGIAWLKGSGASEQETLSFLSSSATCLSRSPGLFTCKMGIMIPLNFTEPSASGEQRDLRNNQLFCVPRSSSL